MVKINNLDFTNISFSEPKETERKTKMIFVNKNLQKFPPIQTPQMYGNVVKFIAKDNLNINGWDLYYLQHGNMKGY